MASFRMRKETIQICQRVGHVSIFGCSTAGTRSSKQKIIICKHIEGGGGGGRRGQLPGVSLHLRVYFYCQSLVILALMDTAKVNGGAHDILLVRNGNK